MACTNPEIPKYAQSAPVINENCLASGSNNGLNIISPPAGGGSGKDAEVLGGFSIESTDLSDVSTDRFLIDYVSYEDVDVEMSIVLFETAVVKSIPILSGTVIDAVVCSWSYNVKRDGDISVQTLVNSGAGGADPVLTGVERGHSYSSLSIQENQTVTITGTDGVTNDSDVDNITFGNYLAIGVSDPSLLNRPASELQAIFDSLAEKTVKTSQAGHSFDAFGSATEYMVIAHPASWGESEFTKGSFTGGYTRIYLVNRGGIDMFVNLVLGTDFVLPIDVDNGKNGFTEEFIYYMSEYPARTGDKPTIISKK